MQKITLVLLVVLFTTTAYGQLNKQQEKNLVAFAKIYGYMQYFHPSDEAKQEYWWKIAIRGCQKVLLAKNDLELIDSLNSLFKPIGPSVKIFPSQQKLDFNINDILPKDTANLKIISWQHVGLNLYGGRDFYQNIRLNRKPIISQNQRISIYLAAKVDSSKFKNCTYVLSLDLKKTRSSFNEPVNISYSEYSSPGPSNKTKNIISEGLDLNYKNHLFKGLLKSSGDTFLATLSFDDDVPIDINNIKLTVLNGSDVVNIPVSVLESKPLLEKPNACILIQRTDSLAKPLFKERLNIGEYIKEEVVKGVTCVIPLALYGDDSQTFPKSDSTVLNSFLSDINLVSLAYNRNTAGDKVEVRLANVIITWNALKHSFPYWSDASSSPKKLLHTSLNDAYHDKNSVDFLHTLTKMGASLNDGHVFTGFYDGSHRIDTSTVPIYFTKIKNKIIVKDVLEAGLLKDISPGDVVKNINGQPAKLVLRKMEALTSGSAQWKESGALVQLLNGTSSDLVNLDVIHNGKVRALKIRRTIPATTYRGGNVSSFQMPTGWVKPGIYYFDLTRTDFDSSQYKILKTAKAIIFDMRGYPVSENVDKIYPLLVKQKEHLQRFYTPKILYPNLKNITYRTSIDEFLPATEHLQGKMYFLTDATAQSAAESFLGVIKDLKLGTIVGSRTSGTNGTLNTLLLPAQYRITFTGMLVKNGDGSKHHLNGITPDILILPTLKSITNRKDYILEKVITIAEKNTGND